MQDDTGSPNAGNPISAADDFQNVHIHSESSGLSLILINIRYFFTVAKSGEVCAMEMVGDTGAIM